MALSGSTDFAITRDELIAASLRLLDQYDPAEGVPANDITTCAEALNLLLKELYIEGVHLWLIRNLSHTLVADQSSYTVGSGGDISIVPPPFRFTSIIYRNSNLSDIELTPLSRDEYWELSTKETKGSPVNYYYVPGAYKSTGTLYLWPHLDTISATSEKIILVYEKMFDDMDSAADDAEIPIQAANAIKWALAAEVALEYGIPYEQFLILRGIADKKIANLIDYGFEDASVYIQPESENYQG